MSGLVDILSLCKKIFKMTIENTRLVQAINELKKEKNAIILVHNYQRPELFKVADFIGDSLELSRKAAETTAEVIVFCGVKFMAETAKILNPEKKVLLPKMEAGCSLADMITPNDVIQLRAAYPGAAFVCYVNTSAEVKAVCDVCCTSANAVAIVNALPHKQVVFLPDQNLGRYVQSKTEKELIIWEGNCAVHHLLDEHSLAEFKNEHPGSRIIAHPECRADILKIADYVCGTGGMAKFADSDGASEFIVVTECGMTNKLREDVPGKRFFSFCNFCPYMKVTTLESVLESLQKMQNEIKVEEKVRTEAAKAVNKMLALA
jgi:quinolinate synthase